MININKKAKERLWSFLYAEKYLDCLKLARTILAVQSEDLNARMLEGVILLNLEGYDGVIFALDKCLLLRSDFFPAFDSRVKAYLMLRNF